MAVKKTSSLKQPTRIQLIWRKTIPYQFILIPMAVYVVFFMIPVFKPFYLGFFDYDGFSPNKVFIGLDNYRKIFSKTNFFSGQFLTTPFGRSDLYFSHYQLVSYWRFYLIRKVLSDVISSVRLFLCLMSFLQSLLLCYGVKFTILKVD